MSMTETGPTTIEVHDLTVLRFQPGDVLLIRAPGPLSPDLAASIRAAIPADVPVLIADQDTEVTALRFADWQRTGGAPPLPDAALKSASTRQPIRKEPA